jgi:hypothetical protein
VEPTIWKVSVRGGQVGHRKIYLEWIGQDGGKYKTFTPEVPGESPKQALEKLLKTASEFDPKEARRAHQLAVEAAKSQVGE